MIERVQGELAEAEALTAHLIDWYLEWAGAEQVARGRFTVETVPAVLETVRQNVRADLPGMLGPRGQLLIDRQHDKVTAMVGLKPVDDATGEIKRMIVDPDFRGRGIGRALLDCLIADARLDGYRTLRLETADFMTSAHALYRSVGFRDVATFDGGEAVKIGLAAGMHYLELPLD